MADVVHIAPDPVRAVQDILERLGGGGRPGEPGLGGVLVEAVLAAASEGKVPLGCLPFLASAGADGGALLRHFARALREWDRKGHPPLGATAGFYLRQAGLRPTGGAVQALKRLGEAAADRCGARAFRDAARDVHLAFIVPSMLTVHSGVASTPEMLVRMAAAAMARRLQPRSVEAVLSACGLAPGEARRVASVARASGAGHRTALAAALPDGATRCAAPGGRLRAAAVEAALLSDCVAMREAGLLDADRRSAPVALLTEAAALLAPSGQRLAGRLAAGGGGRSYGETSKPAEDAAPENAPTSPRL